MSITGRLLVGYESVARTESFRAVDPARRVSLDPPFAIAQPDDVERCCLLAEAAFDSYRQLDVRVRAEFLESCARELMETGGELIERAGLETGLPPARLEGERIRTARQFQLFAEVVRAGRFLELRVDRADPQRRPLPRADLRSRRIALGPVVVFGASNFPLAFSAAGGDVASALAAGCPVVVKGHPAHPGTSELAAACISRAAREAGLPDGVYSHLSSPSPDLGRALVAHPAVKAVAFTGSRAGGLAIAGYAAQRREPIPVFAEMSSINPVVILEHAMAARAEALAQGFVQSLTLGVGQFCTNPGLLFAISGPALERFLACAAQSMARVTPAPMLSASISANYRTGTAQIANAPATQEVARGMACQPGEASGVLHRVRASDLMSAPGLLEEVFGPSGVVVECSNPQQLRGVVARLEGQLTATLHLEPADHAQARLLIPLLERKAGRIVVNGWPTGVEVCHAMVHGGPYPATTDGRVTSVGSMAIERFLRPVCYQDVPQDLLAPELQDAALPQYPHLDNGAFRTAQT